MGEYVNPRGESKESFLDREGNEVDKIVWEEIPVGNIPVIYVDNGPFSAAAIAYSKCELEVFTSPGDYRPKRFYLVPVGKILALYDDSSAARLSKMFASNGLM